MNGCSPTSPGMMAMALAVCGSVALKLTIGLLRSFGALPMAEALLLHRGWAVLEK